MAMIPAMSPKLALTIGAVLAIVFGLGLTLAPGQMLTGFGLGTPNEGVVLSRDVGVTLIGLGIINWLARAAVGTALRAILIGNLFVQVAEIVVNGLEIASGALPAAAAPGMVIHLVLGGIFVAALMRPEAKAV